MGLQLPVHSVSQLVVQLAGVEIFCTHRTAERLGIPAGKCTEGGVIKARSSGA